MLMLLSSTSMAQTVLIVGDSISAGYGISVDQGWVNLLNKRIQQQIVTKPPQSINVINASVSGETPAAVWRVYPNSSPPINQVWWCWSLVVTTAYVDNRRKSLNKTWGK